jgi:hypothetical protein
MMLRIMRKHELIQRKSFLKFLILKLRVTTDRGGYEDERFLNWGFPRLILAILALILMLFSGANAFEAQTSNKNMVRVDVKPIQLTPGEKAIFQVSLNTHSVDLSYDMEEVCILQENEEKVYNVSKWKGSSPGGHHRRGTLEFPALEGNPRSIKLILKGIGDVAERLFEWGIGG